MVLDPPQDRTEFGARASRSGFTLFELMVAMALASVFGMTILMTADTTAIIPNISATVGREIG